jgi:hypothetical protein
MESYPVLREYMRTKEEIKKEIEQLQIKIREGGNKNIILAEIKKLEWVLIKPDREEYPEALQRCLEKARKVDKGKLTVIKCNKFLRESYKGNYDNLKNKTIHEYIQIIMNNNFPDFLSLKEIDFQLNEDMEKKRVQEAEDLNRLLKKMTYLKDNNEHFHAAITEL